jgi:predicted restriction endonuclease
MSKAKQAIRQHFNDVCLKRDRHRCVMCGAKNNPASSKTEDHLDVHHITDRHDLPNGGYVLENGISLCYRCHEKAEEFHSTGLACPGFAPGDLYARIGSTYEMALAASQRMKN